MAIYTKKGDAGETSLFSKNLKKTVRVAKNSGVVRTIGAIDEANSYLGVAASYKFKYRNLIQDVQTDLLTIGSLIAGARLPFSHDKIVKLEKVIDRLEGKLPVLKNFIIPGGTELASKLFYARALVRRAERELVSLRRRPGFGVNGNILAYLNRLSDLLFMLGRFINHKKGYKERVWKVVQ